MLTIIKLGVLHLQQLCQKSFIGMLSPTTVYPFLISCVELQLNEMQKWAIWFAGKHKVPLTADGIQALVSHQELELIAMVTQQIGTLTLPPPPNLEVNPLLILPSVARLFDSSEYSDFSIRFKNGDPPLPVHKCILGPQWDFFSILMRDKVFDNPIPHSTFQKFIRYFYTHEVESFTLRDCGWVLAVADMWLLSNHKPLIDHCEEVVNSVNSSNWFEALQLALEIGNEGLEQAAMVHLPGDQRLGSFFLGMLKNQHREIANLKKEITELKHSKQEEIADLKKEIAELKANNKKS